MVPIGLQLEKALSYPILKKVTLGRSQSVRAGRGYDQNASGATQESHLRLADTERKMHKIRQQPATERAGFHNLSSQAQSLTGSLSLRSLCTQVFAWGLLLAIQVVAQCHHLRESIPDHLSEVLHLVISLSFFLPHTTASHDPVLLVHHSYLSLQLEQELHELGGTALAHCSIPGPSPVARVCR